MICNESFSNLNTTFILLQLAKYESILNWGDKGLSTNKKIEWNTGYHWDQDYYFIKENDVKRLHKILNAIDNHKPSKINPVATGTLAV